MSVIRDRVQGILLGLAAGDRNGGPIRMAVRLAESLVELRRFDPQDILDRYLAWWRDDAFDTGPTTAQVLSLIDAGVDATEAVERVHDQAGGMTAGCNPAHRCAPLAMAPFLPDDELAGSALREAGLTHHHPLAGDVAAAVAVLCRALIRGEHWDDAVSRAAAGRLGPTVQALDENSWYPMSPGGYAPEVLRAAAHFVAGHDSFADALGASLAFAGPANYCPVLVGTVAGARWGRSASRWIHFLVNWFCLASRTIASEIRANDPLWVDFDAG
jgi:ADP-ribosyl-[dinitrogen reductase] hydrolase